MKKESVTRIINEVIEDVCDNWCKMPVLYPMGEDEDIDEWAEKHCEKCPLDRLG